MSRIVAGFTPLRAHEVCRVCGHKGWCMDGRADGAVCCRREPSDHPIGEAGWLHWPGGQPAAPPPRPPRRPKPEPGAELAPLEQRALVYRVLGRVLGLSGRHFRHLVDDRGLPEDAVIGFATLPGGGSSRDVAAAVEEVAGTVRGVPGFYRDRDGWRLTSAPAGFLIPVRAVGGMIRAMQIRLDDPPDKEHRYRPLSTAWAAARQGGTSPGSPAAVWRGSRLEHGCWITEGPLKGAVLAYHARSPVDGATVGLLSHATWRTALELLGEGIRPGYPVTIALDADWLSNDLVRLSRDQLGAELVRRGMDVRVAVWDFASAKGIDDALQAGLQIRTEKWWRELPPPREPRRYRALVGVTRRLP